MKNKDIYNFLISLARDLNKFYKLKLNKKFKAKNKGSDSNYDPVTIADKKFEKFIRTKIINKFPKHSIIGEEFGLKNKKSDYSWVIDPIDGTRSFVIGYPSWSNLIAFCYKDKPIMGLANFPILNKFYIILTFFKNLSTFLKDYLSRQMIDSKLSEGTNFLSEISLQIIHMPKKIEIVNRKYELQ